MMKFCASCGVKEDDDIKLKTCNACYLVRYCGSKCQRDHWPQHKRECKRRAAELRDEILFTQPESSHMGDCPICCLPLSLDVSVTTMMTCCGKTLCGGCYYANQQREFEQRLQRKCPFCRQPEPNSVEEQLRYVMKRIEANDPLAMKEMGLFCLLERKDHKSAFDYWSKAARLGDLGAHYQLSRFYRKGGNGVEKDEKKRVYHLEEAAIGGHVDARYELGNFEAENERYARATKHFIIAANMGHVKSLELLKDNYAKGFVAKDDFASALRAHKAAVEATKSPQRESGEAYLRMQREQRKLCAAAGKLRLF